MGSAGRFLGRAGIKPYRSLPLGMNEHEMYSYWYLPFSEGARIEIENDGTEACEISAEIWYTLYPSLMRRTSCVFIPNGIGMIIWIWIRSASRETEIAGRIGLCADERPGKVLRRSSACVQYLGEAG